MSGDVGDPRRRASGERRHGTWYSVLAALAPVGLLVGLVVAFCMLSWAPGAFRDVFGIPTPPPVPGPAPPVAYWASWLVPLGLVFVAGAIASWRWQRFRLFFATFTAGYTVVLVLLGPIWMSCSLGGCAPT